MEKPVSELMAAISPEEWAQVPASVLELIQELVRRKSRNLPTHPVTISPSWPALLL
jgi:hypothetical protein